MAERAAKQLELNKSELPNSITEVIATLSRAGFDAYIVGGGVRDTLLGLRPKDFDAVTDAKPHEIKDVFGKRCRIIGRRFQLAHVYSGRELIEVATFRGPPLNDSNTNQDGMILRDNVWGDIKQDFARRDFSINALYYQPLKGVVHDFCGALEDIDNKIIRLLGNAPTRIEEDPVRLLRALRFKAKLGFDFDSELAAQFHDGNWALLEQISPHRLYDETQKMFTGGYLVPLLPLLFESGAIDSLVIYPPAEPSALVKQVAINTDKRIGAGKSINPAFFYAALLWENYLHQLEKAKKRNMPFAEAQMHAAGKVIDRQRIKTAIPKFAEQFIRDIWILQPKLAAPRSKQIVQLSEHPRFRAGFDFLLLREQCGDAEHPLSESTNGMGEWWHNYQTLTEQQQDQAIDDFDENIRRGAYKRDRGSQKQKGNNDNVEIQNSRQKTPSYQDNSGQPSAEQKMTNAPNVPSRRRRREPNPNNVLQSNAQSKQDSHEWAQLQQLSLANHSDSSQHKRDHAKPMPLFVVAQGNVVPPLKKQLPPVETAKSNDKEAVTQSKASANKTPQYEDAKDTKDTKNKANHSTKQSQVERPQKDTKHVSNAVNETARTIGTPAQKPQLVMTNNEPIPYKRRRRQPSIDMSVEVSQQSAEAAKSVSSNKVTRANKTNKAKSESSIVSNNVRPTKPKPMQKSKTLTQAKQTTQSSGDKGNNQGPIPAKRRRRQPSTDSL